MRERLWLEVKGGECEEVRVKDLFKGERKRGEKGEVRMEVSCSGIWYGVEGVGVVGNGEEDDGLWWGWG